MFNVSASLRSMTIERCSKLKSIFVKQQLGTSELVQGSSCSDSIVSKAVSQLSSSPVNHFFPCLESLRLKGCGSLSGVLLLPPSLETIVIESCNSIQVMSCQLDGLRKPEVTASINALDPSAVATAPGGEHSLPPCLAYLYLESYAGMLGGILIKDTSGLTSLDPVLGQPLSLERLWLYGCTALASLSNEPQAYGSLCDLQVMDCPSIKNLPRCLHQRLGSIMFKTLDAQYKVVEFKPFKPKTWKEIPRLVRGWRHADRE